MKLYLSGPMSGHPRFNFDLFDDVQMDLETWGHEIVSPAEHDREVLWTRRNCYPEDIPGFAEGDVALFSQRSGFSYEEAISWDLAVITTCQGIVMLPGWETSTGAGHELYVAKACGLDIYYAVVNEHNLWRFLETDPQAPSIIGLSGYAQAGKDSIGAVLVAEYGFERISFADALKDMLYALNPRLDVDWRIANQVDSYGWERAKSVDPEVRRLLQRLGTEAGRNVLGADIWVQTAMKKVKPGGKYVFTDVRFPNEAEAIRALSGQMWRVTRDNHAPANDHPSETALDGYAFDYYFHTDPFEELSKLTRYALVAQGHLPHKVTPEEFIDG